MPVQTKAQQIQDELYSALRHIPLHLQARIAVVMSREELEELTLAQSVQSVGLTVDSYQEPYFAGFRVHVPRGADS